MRTYIWMTAALILATAVTGCKKCDPADDRNTNPLTQNTLYSDADLTAEVEAEFQESSFTGGTESESFAIENDGLPEVYRLSGTSLDLKNPALGNDSSLRIRACLHKLRLSRGQMDTVLHLNKRFADCKHELMRNYMTALSELMHKVEMQRRENLDLLHKGTITREEFETRMKALRAKMGEGMKLLKHKEAAGMKECLAHFMKGLKATLTEEQWKAFIGCYSRKRPNKI